jgi:hypothetical protein
MRNKAVFLFILGAMALGACQAIDSQTPVPARLLVDGATVSDQVGEELQDTISLMLGTRVTIASNTLTTSSTFAYARAPRINAQGQLLQGRVIEQPQIFKLMKIGNACWLEHTNSGKKIKLHQAQCIAEQ